MLKYVFHRKNMFFVDFFKYSLLYLICQKNQDHLYYNQQCITQF